MNNAFNIPAGSRVFLGAPTNPIAKGFSDLLHKIVSEDPEVIEAHFPQCYIPGLMTEPRQVLFIICLSRSSAEQSVLSAMKHLTDKIFTGGIVDILPLTITDELVDAVREAGCQIYQQKS